jgi:hypothetical protein
MTTDVYPQRCRWFTLHGEVVALSRQVDTRFHTLA